MFCYKTEGLEGEVAFLVGGFGFWVFLVVYFEVYLVKYWSAPSYNREKTTRDASYCSLMALINLVLTLLLTTTT